MDSSSCINSRNINRALIITLAIIVILTLILLIFKSILQSIRRSSSNNQTSLEDQVDAAAAVTGPIPESEPAHTCCSDNVRHHPDDLPSITIPILTYVASSDPAADSESCSICLSEFSHGDTVRVLPKCKHTFHKDCIDQWIPNRSSFCPICRDRAIEQDAEPPRTNNCTNNGIPASVILNFGNTTHIPSFL